VSSLGQHGTKKKQDNGSTKFLGTKENTIDLELDLLALETQDKGDDTQALISG
jgi:hypothetical protein